MSDRVEDESFMVACLSMASAYLGYVRAELRLYRSRQGHKPLESNFDALTAALEERIKLHRSRLNPPAPKPVVKLKARDVERWRCDSCGGTSRTGHQRLCEVVLRQARVLKNKPKLKRRVV